MWIYYKRLYLKATICRTVAVFSTVFEAVTVLVPVEVKSFPIAVVIVMDFSIAVVAVTVAVFSKPSKPDILGTNEGNSDTDTSIRVAMARLRQRSSPYTFMLSRKCVDL